MCILFIASCCVFQSITLEDCNFEVICNSHVTWRHAVKIFGCTLKTDVRRKFKFMMMHPDHLHGQVAGLDEHLHALKSDALWLRRCITCDAKCARRPATRRCHATAASSSYVKCARLRANSCQGWARAVVEICRHFANLWTFTARQFRQLLEFQQYMPLERWSNILKKAWC